MKFKVDKQTLSRAISQVENIISPREIRMIVSNLLVEAKDEWVHLTSTDLEISIKTRFPAEVISEGSSTLLAKKLSQVIREFQGKELMLEADENNRIEIRDASGDKDTRITMMGASSEDYPTVKSLEQESYQPFSMPLFLEMIDKTEYAMAEDDARYVFNGIYIVKEEEQIAFVATDGRRLAKIRRQLNVPEKVAEGVILPNKAVRELKKIMEAEGEGLLAYDEGERSLYFRVGDIDLITRLIDGQFPNYNQVIPEKMEHRIEVERGSLEKSLRLAAVMAAEPSLQVRAIFKPGNITLSSSTPDLGDASDTLEAKGYEGEEIAIAFNSRYLLEIIKALKEENVIIQIQSSNAPVMVVDPGDQLFTSVVMPMKI